MAQAGLHALVGIGSRKVAPKREWLVLGIILGSVFPDLDSYAVAVATVAKVSTQGLHRTFTHSLFAILVAVVVFFLIAQACQQPRWANLGVGFGLGIGMHIVLDLLIWFNGVELLWPWGGWVNLWAGIKPPAWFAALLEPAELLFFALYFVWLAKAAKDHHTNTDFLFTLHLWTMAMMVLCIIFTPLAYLLSKGFLTVFGTVYLIALTAAFIITIRMWQTVEA